VVIWPESYLVLWYRNLTNNLYTREESSSIKENLSRKICNGERLLEEKLKDQGKREGN
jgi:hypothetical protein